MEETGTKDGEVKVKLKNLNTSDHDKTVARIFGHHRGLSSTLYMAKPNTANTVAPMLALSQKVEVLRSVGLMCLSNREEPERDKQEATGRETSWKCLFRSHSMERGRKI